MSITGVLGRGWGSPTDWSGINPRNNGKDHPDQAKDASCSGSTKELCRSEMKADRVRAPVCRGGGGRAVEIWKGIKRLKRCRIPLLRMPPKRASTTEAPAMTQDAIRKLVADSVTSVLEAQVATMASASNPNRNSTPSQTPTAS
ncbi:hypothetical protein Tco_1078997 [Tanacetum coccineum]|uniref:Uncharacterized protein n=1 Tax=Tanacetum coccineum TaxID=301880 RepID=A0ABQ5HQK9_9ASTR